MVLQETNRLLNMLILCNFELMLAGSTASSGVVTTLCLYSSGWMLAASYNAAMEAPYK